MKLVAFILGLLLSVSFSQESKSVSFSETNENFANPERGWMEGSWFSKRNNDYEWNVAKDKVTLMWTRIKIDNFRSQPLSQDFLDELDKYFEKARDYGVKIIPRFTYGYGRYDDAPIERVLEHIGQLKPVIRKNSDVLNVFDPGFIGWWGEWHSSSNNLTDEGNMKQIIDALLDMLPLDRMMYIRYPHYKLRHFGGSYTASEPWLDSTQAFSGSDISRIGHLNDCFLSGSSDVGTYQQGIDREMGLKYIGQESAYVPHGGETCQVTNESLCDNAIKEMETLHTNHLHNGFKQNVYERWDSDGCYDEITRRFGYRFALESASYTSEVPPGGLMDLSFAIKNVGFGELFNPRNVYVVLQGESGSKLIAPIASDPRWWSAGKTTYVGVKLQIPTNVSQDKYTLSLWLPDASPSIEDDSRYSVRFANENVWDENSGSNIITRDLIISNNAPGAVNGEFTEFKQLGFTGIKKKFSIKNDNMFQVNYLTGKKTLAVNNIPTGLNSLEFEIFDLQGRSIWVQQINPALVNDNQFNAYLAGINPGVHLIKVTGDNMSKSRRFTVIP